MNFPIFSENAITVVLLYSNISICEPPLTANIDLKNSKKGKLFYLIFIARQ